MKKIIEKSKKCSNSVTTFDHQDETNWSEDKIQQTLFTWFHHAYPSLRGLLYMNYNNPRNKVSGSILKGMGLVAGVPDMFLAIPNKSYHGFYIELKRWDGKVSDDQKEIQPILLSRGYKVDNYYSYWDARQAIESYLLLDNLNLLE